MKAYFIVRQFLEESLNSQSSGIALRSYKIEGNETLTNDFFVDNQVVSADAKTSYYFCTANTDGSDPISNIISPTSYNPFSKHFGTNYALTNGLMRGLPIGTINGKNYGQGVLNFGVDKPKVLTGSNTLTTGAFFLEIDFSKDLYVEFDIVTNIINGQVFENPQILRKYKISWEVSTCKRSFSYFSYQTNEEYVDNGLGFLRGATSLNSEPYINFSIINCGNGLITPCDDKDRSRSFALFISIPETGKDPAETIQECCYQARVLATTENNDYEKNDFTGFWHKKQTPNETADFYLVDLSNSEEIELNNGEFGQFKEFGTIPDNPDLKTFILSWKKVLEEKGEGNFTVVKRVTIAGISYDESDINYSLKKYTTKRADTTVRIDVRMTGLMERLNVDFENSNFETSIRFNGFFGRREPKFEEDNIVYANFESKQISMKQTNEYQLQSNLLPSCVTQPIFDFMIFGNDIYINDYNLNNHIREFIKFPVKFADNKGTGYFTVTTKAQLNLTFSDKILDNIKRNY